MNRVFLFSFHVFLCSSLCSAEATMLHSGSFRETLRTVGSIIKSSDSAFSIFQNLAPSVLMSKIALLIRNGFENSQKIENEAKVRNRQFIEVLKRNKSYEEIRQERTQKIKELKKKIQEARYSLQYGDEQSLEDMQSELSELLERPAELDFDDEKSALFSSDLEPIKQSPAVNSFVVPGMRMAAPKKSEGNRQGKKSEPEGKSVDAQAQGGTTALQDASILAPVVAVGIGVTVQTPSGPLSIQIPSELQPVFFTLHSENLALKAENQQLKSRCMDLGQRLQSETDRSASYERDLQRVLNDYQKSEKRYKNLEDEYESLREEIARLRAENAALRKENEDLKRILSETQARLSRTEDRLSEVESRLNDLQYHMEISETLNYVNIGARNAFQMSRFGPGFVAIAKKANSGQMDEAESRIWANFVQQHPNAEDQDVIGFIDELSSQRVVRAHPSVRKLTKEQLAERLEFFIEKGDPLIKKIIDLVWSFPL